MNIRPKSSSPIRVKKMIGDLETEEFKKIKEATDEDGSLDLSDVYEIPQATETTGKQKTIAKYMEKEGIEYTEREYQKEYQLKAAHQIMLNGGTTATIAQSLSITLNEARSLKRELAARQLSEIKNFNAQGEIAKAYMFYDHIMAKALQLSNKGGDKNMRNQIEGLKVALQAQTDKQKFLALAGAYEQGLRAGDVGNKHTNDANKVRELMTGILSGDTYEVQPDEEETDDGISIL